MMTPEIERKGRHLLSQTPREELSSFLYERAMRWRDLDKRVFAAEALAWSFGLDANNGAHEESLNRFLNEWTGWTKQLQPPGFPDITIGTPRGHRFFPEELPLKYEQEILGLRATER